MSTLTDLDKLIFKRMCKNFIGVPAMRAAIQQTSLAETKMSLLNILAFYRVVSEQLSRDQEMMRPIMITKIYQQFNDWLSV